MKNHLRMLIISISLISFILLLVGCQLKSKDEFERKEIKRTTSYDCQLDVYYDEDEIELKFIFKYSNGDKESLLVLKKQNDSFILDSINVLMGKNDKVISKEILSTKNFHYSVVDTLTPLNDVYKIDVYNYSKGEEFISTISQYYRPQSMIRIYYNKDFRIHKVKVVFGVDEFVFESSKYKMSNLVDEKTIVYPKFFNDMKRDSLEFLKENQHGEWAL